VSIGGEPDFTDAQTVAYLQLASAPPVPAFKAPATGDAGLVDSMQDDLN